MSEQTSEVVELPHGTDSAFATLMDALAPDQAPEASKEGEGAPSETAGTDPVAGAEAPVAQPGTPPAGDQPATGADSGTGAEADKPADAGGEPAPSGSGDRPAAWTTPAAELIPKFGELSTALQERTTQAYQQTALDEVKSEHANYFEALEKHPRLLVGTEVPAIGKEGTERLKDAADAAEWQDAVKSLLVAEVRDRASKALDENKEFLELIHASIELFQNNSDLVPGSKEFDVELANRFATLATPYELRTDGKLQGYSIPVQPIIDQLRTQITAERAAKPAAPAEPAAPPKPADPPQAGIPSKAGSGADTEDFSTLFGTIGLPNLQI